MDKEPSIEKEGTIHQNNSHAGVLRDYKAIKFNQTKVNSFLLINL